MGVGQDNPLLSSIVLYGPMVIIKRNPPRLPLHTIFLLVTKQRQKHLPTCWICFTIFPDQVPI